MDKKLLLVQPEMNEGAANVAILAADQATNLRNAMKQLVGIFTALLIATQAHAQSDATSAMVYYPSCLAAAEIVQGKHPTADSEDAAKQLNKAAICFGAVTAIMNLEPFFKPEFAVYPPADSKVSFAQIVLAITTHLKNHPEQLRNNFH
jgi:hypothetical protein